MRKADNKYQRINVDGEGSTSLDQSGNTSACVGASETVGNASEENDCILLFYLK